MARLVSGRAVRTVTHAATLTHGGYGFMEEQDIPLFCRRAKQLERLVEGPVEQRELLASQEVADMDRVR
jgi:alkylation response protein AidB-like acyl-CoA dehydrogenase